MGNTALEPGRRGILSGFLFCGLVQQNVRMLITGQPGVSARGPAPAGSPARKVTMYCFAQTIAA
jgi:hypothetical protein